MLHLLGTASHTLLNHAMPQWKGRPSLFPLPLIKPDSLHWAAVTWSLLLITNLKYSVIDPSRRSQMPGFVTSRRKLCAHPWCTTQSCGCSLSPSYWSHTARHDASTRWMQPQVLQPSHPCSLLPDWYLLQRASSVLNYLILIPERPPWLHMQKWPFSGLA